MSVNGIYLKDFAPCVRILDQAVRMAIADEEPGNLVRQHTATIENELRGAGVSLERAHELACARVIGSEPGGGGARLVWFLPRSGTWQERSEINELWRTMRTHVYTGKLWGARLPELHDKIYAGTEGVISNWSDNLLSPLTNHHYPEEAGGLAMSVQWITGKKPDVSVFDLRRRENAGAIGLEEVLSLELRSVALNKEWIRGQMVHGYIGATQFMQIVDNSFQWEAVRQGAIWPGAWDKITDVYVRDSLGLGLREWFDKANPFAFQELTATLLEASRKGYWAADPTTVRQLATAHAESVARFGHGAGPYAGGNLKLRGYLSDALNRPEDEGLRTAYLTKVNDAEKVPEGPRVTQSRPAEEPSLTAGTEAPAVHADKPAASGEAMASEARKSLGTHRVSGRGTRGRSASDRVPVEAGHLEGALIPKRGLMSNNSVKTGMAASANHIVAKRTPLSGAQAFTLIEVLVVVAIIALLISILLPSLSVAREHSAQSVCLSNLRQFGLAMEMYLNQYGCFVPVTSEKGEYGRWLRLLDNVRSDKNQAKRSALVMAGTCPTVPDRARALQLTSHKMDRDIAYGYNYIYLGDSRWLYKPGLKGRFPVRGFEIKAPARTIAIADSDGTGGWCPAPDPYAPEAANPNAIGHHGFMIDPPALPSDVTTGPAFDPTKCTLSTKPGYARVSDRHRGTASVLYVEGHAAKVRRELLEKNNAPWNGLRAEP